MENASKALVMAGGVLIAIMLLTLFTYLFSRMSSSTSGIYQLIEKHEKDEFNQQFLNYEGREITPQDVATLINLAQNSEKNSKFYAKVEVTLNGNPISMLSNKWLEENGNTQNKYKCKTVNINTDTLLVDKVYIYEERP